MFEPVERIEKYYTCPHCRLWASKDRDAVATHMAGCGYNPELPKKECHTCAHSYITNERMLAGHDRGPRAVVNTRVQHCRRGCKLNPGNRCGSYQSKKLEEARHDYL